MGKLLAALLFGLVLAVSCNYPQERAVYYPSKACMKDHYRKWSKMARMGTGAQVAGSHTFDYAPGEYQGEYILRHNQDLGGLQMNFFFFDLYKEADAMDYSSASVEDDSSASVEILLEPPPTDMSSKKDGLVLKLGEGQFLKLLETPKELKLKPGKIGKVSLTEDDVEDIFQDKETRGVVALLNRKDMRDAFAKKKTQQEESTEEVEITSGYFKGLKFRPADLVDAFTRKSEEEPKGMFRDLQDMGLKGEDVLDALHQNSEEDDELGDFDAGKGEKLIPLTFQERPKLFITRDNQRLEHALRLIQIEMPSDVYNPNNWMPVHLIVSLYFYEKEHEEDYENDFVVEYPVYGHVEYNTDEDITVTNFLKDIAGNELAKLEPIVHSLEMLKPALDSITKEEPPVYYDTERSCTVALAGCEYVDNEVLRGVFVDHHARLVSEWAQYSTVLPTESYRYNPEAEV